MAQGHGVTGFYLIEAPTPDVTALLAPGGALAWAQVFIIGEAGAPSGLWRPAQLPPLDASGALEDLVAATLSATGKRLSISLHHELAQLLCEGWSLDGACTELTERVQALPAPCLGQLELGGFQRWPDGRHGPLHTAPADHRVPAALWEVLEALVATGHAPGVRLAWERDLPGLAVMLDEARRARALLG